MMPINLLVANRGEIAIRDNARRRRTWNPHARDLFRGRCDFAAYAQGRRAPSPCAVRAPPPISTSIRSSPSRRPRVATRSIRATAFSAKTPISPAAAPRRASASSGPRPEILELFGDKVQAAPLAERCGVPVLPGTSGPTSLNEARAFLSALGPGGAMMIKAVAGGGGRGMRPVTQLDRARGGLRALRSRRPAAPSATATLYRRAADAARPPCRGADRRRQRRRSESPVASANAPSSAATRS